jgi:hypothetical protein
MKIVGYCADRHGYLRTSDQGKVFGWEHRDIFDDRSQHSKDISPCGKVAVLPSSCLPFKHRYKDLIEEGEEHSSKICGGRLLSRFLQRKLNSDNEASWTQSTDSSSFSDECSSPSRSTRAKADDKDGDLNHGTMHQVLDLDDNVRNISNSNIREALSVREQRQSVKAGSSRTIVPPYLENQGGNDSMTYSVSDIGMSNDSAMGAEWFGKGSIEEKEKTTSKSWAHYVHDEMATVIIAKLVDDCHYYRSEVATMREEIDYLKMELDCLRRDASGLRGEKDERCLI